MNDCKDCPYIDNIKLEVKDIREKVNELTRQYNTIDRKQMAVDSEIKHFYSLVEAVQRSQNELANKFDSFKTDILKEIRIIGENLAVNDYKTNRGVDLTDKGTKWFVGIMTTIVTLIISSAIASVFKG